ncbi:MAG TPA: hypothetical protein VMG12_28625, partial [Polyangiaceae bacterium]|nr:hypothetical protein [Polyangiaceae bacterium]
MKSVLRHQSVGITALAAIALALSACSGAEGAAFGADDSVSDDATPSVTDTASSTAQQPAAPEQSAPVARTEQPQTAPESRTETPARATSPASTPARGTSAEGAATEETTAPSAAPAPVHTRTMRVVGNQLFDSCGQPFVVRGVEQILGNQLPQGNDWLGLVRQIASTG